jgi:hypothetical protein
VLRQEQFAVGVALIASALAIILSKSLAWLILVVGFGFILDFYLRDLIWGTDRLTRAQIEALPAEEYKTRVLRNRQTERWVNWLYEGRDAFKKQMRKLARQAVIFMLVTPLVLFGGRLAYLHHNAANAIAATVDKLPGMSQSVPIPCNAGEFYMKEGRVVWTCQNGVRTSYPLPPPGFIPVNGVLVQSDTFGLNWLLSGWWFSLYGIPVGFALWVLYRAVRFAIRG